MATYAIGDLQGCLDEFEALLAALSFKPGSDELWLLGDLINRGPKSLETLRYVKALGASARVVLGNHDLHFLAVHYGGHDVRRSDTLDDLLGASDVDELATWLRCKPLVHHSASLGWLMVHAGVPPTWQLADLLERAEEARVAYAGAQGESFFQQMYGNAPDVWQPELRGIERTRCVVNHLTRMRFIRPDGALDFAVKGALETAPETLLPWFQVPRTEPLGARIAFGHWAALEGETPRAPSGSVAALDTGCVWGRALTALCLESGERIAVAAGDTL